MAPLDNPRQITSHVSFAWRGQYLRALNTLTLRYKMNIERATLFHRTRLSQLLLGSNQSWKANSSHDERCNSTLPSGLSCWAHYFLINMRRGSIMQMTPLFTLKSPSQVTHLALFSTLSWANQGCVIEWRIKHWWILFRLHEWRKTIPLPKADIFILLCEIWFSHRSAPSEPTPAVYLMMS